MNLDQDSSIVVPVSPQGGSVDHLPGPTVRWSFEDYFWFILKNIIGWILIVAAWPVGLLVPGPGGLPLFLIGFAMITFPGKRKLTARVLRGRPLNLAWTGYRWIAIFFGLLFPGIALAILSWRFRADLDFHSLGRPQRVMIYLVFALICWLLARVMLRSTNVILRIMARTRRKVRPWMRRHGIDLLPPRRRKRHRHSRHAPTSPPSDPDEIIQIHPRHFQRLSRYWNRAKPWLRNGIGLAIMVMVVIWFTRRIEGHWEAIDDKIRSTSFIRIFIASVMFAIFLFLFRAISWRRILIGFGHRLPVAAATRIWSVSELARYLPGAIWQVLGRVYLVRRYGVDAATSSTSQVLELTIFLLANLFAGLVCLPWFGGRMDADARWYLYLATGLAPLLLLLLHPKIFLGVINRLLKWVGKPPFALRLQKRLLAKLMAWSMLGLAWQGLALWVLMSQPDTLGLKLSQLPLIVGAYCLAWCAGFLAVTNPAGFGVREAVLVTILRFSLPTSTLDHFGGDERALKAFLMFLGLLLRLWTIIGELIVAGLAYVIDYRTWKPGTMPSSK